MSAAELVVLYHRYCSLNRLQKPNSAVLLALKTLHDEQRAAGNEACPLRTLDLSRDYLGPRGILAVAALTEHIPTLVTLNLSGAQWFSGDERVCAPSGEDTLAVFCKLVAGHPSMSCIELGDCEFGPAQYVRLVELIKASPRLVSLHLASPFLRQHEKAHLDALLRINAKRLSLSLSVEPRGTAEPLEGEPQESRRDATPRGDALLGRKEETVVRSLLDPRKADMLLGCADLAQKKIAAPLLRRKTPEEVRRFVAYFDMNPVLMLVPVDVRERDIVPHVRYAKFALDEIIFERHDPVDYVGLLIHGGAVSQRSEEVTMVHPPGSLIGDEEVRSSTAAESRRFSIRARPTVQSLPMSSFVAMTAADRRSLGKDHTEGLSSNRESNTSERCEVLLIPSRLFLEHVEPRAEEHRARWRKICDITPAFQTLGTISKLLVADAMQEAHYAPHGVVAAGASMLDRVIVVVDGSLVVYYRQSQVKKLVRGEVFVCHAATDVAMCSVVATEKSVIGLIAESHFRTLAWHIQEHMASLARHISLEDVPLTGSIFRLR